MSDKDECRQAFKKWAADNVTGPNKVAAWSGWQAAWNAREKDAEDARRYQWLRIHGAAPCEDSKHHLERGIVMRANVLDEFIDAAMNQRTEGEG